MYTNPIEELKSLILTVEDYIEFDIEVENKQNVKNVITLVGTIVNKDEYTLSENECFEDKSILYFYDDKVPRYISPNNVFIKRKISLFD